jgi:nicotinamide-nucleotide amidase
VAKRPEPRAPVVEVLGTGDELVSGAVRDANFQAAATLLGDRGYDVRGGRVVGDDLEALAGALREAASRADVVVVSGGLGPTEDDLTRDAAARVLGVPLELHGFSRRLLLSEWRRKGLPMPASTLRQAMLPRGTDFLHNSVGSAPGFRFRLGDAAVFCLPGPPREMAAMLEAKVAPLLLRLAPRPPRARSARVSCCGVTESSVGERLADLMQRGKPVRVGTSVSEGVVTVSIRGTGHAALLVGAVRNEVLRRLGADAYAAERVPPGENLVRLLVSKGLTVAAAESCTGGLVGARLTDLPGSSKAFLGGVVAYANGVKTGVLGVPGALLRKHGAVSRPVVEAMARGVRRITGADLGVAVTGVAGPGGGTAAKPVGHVWLAAADRAGVRAVERRWLGGRATVRGIAANTAIDLVRRWVERGTEAGGPRQRGVAQGTVHRAQG